MFGISKKWITFLIDVFICSLGSYGGPEAHLSVFIDQMVTKKKYLTEEELLELVALGSILPGPTSSQAMVGIGYKVGGEVLALLTMLVWALPAILIMTTLSFLYDFLEYINVSSSVLRLIGPLSVGFIAVATYRISKKVITDRMTLGLMIFGLLSVYFFNYAWVFPTILIIGGIVAILLSKEKDIWNTVKLNPPWIYLIAFFGFALLNLVLVRITGNILITLFEAFYRFGFLVFGGGQVVVPLMFSELVDTHAYMTNQEFLTGYGLVQGIPGPMFSFSAYAGGMAARGHGPIIQIIGALLSGIGIFLPGTLLIFFAMPVWEKLREIRAIKISLKGINAVAGGMIASSAIRIMQRSGFTLENIIVFAVVAILLLTKKIPAPLIVLLVLIAGILI